MNTNDRTRPSPAPAEDATPPTRSSNRAQTPPRTTTNHDRRALHEVLGIDYITLNFPIKLPAPAFFDQDRVDYISNGSIRRTGSRTFEFEGMKVDLRAYPTRDGHKASVRFNPSHHQENSGSWQGLPITSLPSVLHAVWPAVHDHVTPTVALAEAGVGRLDIERSFTVTAAARTSLMEGASVAPVPYAKRRSIWKSPTGVVQSVYASTKRQGSVLGYDHHERHSTSPPDTYRVEVQARKGWLNRYGQIETVADLGPSTIEALFLNRFHWSGFGVPVIHEHARTQRLWELTAGSKPALTRLEVQRLLGRERLLEAGIEVPEGSSSSSARKATTRLAGVAHTDVDGPEIIRLDPHYDTPRQTAAA
jgi:hypothetical protein